MKKLLFFLVGLWITAGSWNCHSQAREQQPVGKPQKTRNPNTPYIYENGYKEFAIAPRAFELNGTQITTGELRFKAAFSAMYTQSVMLQKFGKWHRQIPVYIPANGRLPAVTVYISIWENIRLFENDPTLFTVVCDGKESWDEMYTSVMVIGPNNDDALKTGSKYREMIVSLFSNGIQNLKL